MVRNLLIAILVALWVIPACAFAKPPNSLKDGSETAAPATSPPTSTIEVLPMPHENADVTCPYLRQQKIDRHAYQFADLDLGRDVLDNLKRLKQADELLESAKDLARTGLIDEAMECCARAAELCPGSPCASRAADTMLELALGIGTATSDFGEAAKPELKQIQAEWERIWFAEMPSLTSDWPRFPDVLELMRAPMSQGIRRGTPSPAGSSEESEPPTCPYCGKTGKPIREIVPEKAKKDAHHSSPPPAECEIEVGASADGGLRLSADCTLSGKVYHLRFKQGHLAIWKTADAGGAKP